MKKEFWLIIILAIIIVILTVFIVFVPAKKQLENKGFYGDENSIQLLLMESNMEISSPFTIHGRVNGNGWVGFEGQVGTVELINSEGTSIMTAILTATTEWTQLPTNFESTLSFSGYEGPATLVFHNENPSGLPEKNKTLTLPVILKAGPETMKVLVYFQGYGPGNECENVIGVERQVPKTDAVARAALEQLLGGPRDQDGDTITTSINSGVKIQSLKIEDGTAYVDFNQALQTGVGGSCKVAAIRAQITQTLKQFPTVKNVIISIDGKTEDILQP